MSKTVLYMAVSADGFIASEDDDVSWVSKESWRSYEEFVASCDVVLVGRKTYELLPKDEFITGPEYIIVSRDSDSTLDAGSLRTISIKSKADMPHVTAKGAIGVIGGGDLNGRLAELGLLDEMIIDIEPVELGAGTRLFGKHDVPLKLKLLESKQLSEQTVQRHYQIINSGQ